MSCLVGVASAASLSVIVLSLISIGVIVNDIQSMQSDINKDINEVKVRDTSDYSTKVYDLQYPWDSELGGNFENSNSPIAGGRR